MKTMLSAPVKDDLLVNVVGAVTPSDEEWGEFLELVEAWVERADPNATLRLLAHSAGGGPNARQRKRVFEILDGRNARASIVTSSVLARGIATAVSWFIPANRAFSPDDMQSAYTHLSLTEEERKAVEESIARLRPQLSDR